MVQGLEEALATLNPQLEGSYVFVTSDTLPPGLTPFAVIEEAEGKTLIIPAAQAMQYGFGSHPVFARITPGTPTSLSSVGITATITQTIASRGIPCNVIAGFYHDHFFVPEKHGREVVSVLENLSKQAEGWLPTATEQ